jgi:uncharacterized RDD family membrane protein YckC
MKLVNCVKRFIALLIDFIIINVINFILLIMLVIITKVANVQPFNESYNSTVWPYVIQYVFPITGFTLAILYFVVMETKYNATLGKMVLKLRLRTENGEKISALRALIRLFLLVITSFAGIGFIFFLFNKKNQFLHDWLTKTYVE